MHRTARWDDEMIPSDSVIGSNLLKILDSAMAFVGQATDPQTDAAIRLSAWSSRGMLRVLDHVLMPVTACGTRKTSP